MRHLSNTVSAILAFASISAIADNKRPLYDQLSEAVVRLERGKVVEEEGQRTVKNVPAGTGFFVVRMPDLYLVSARHVVDKPFNLAARVIWRNQESGRKEVFWLNLPHGKWVYHPKTVDDPNALPVDVAVMKIPWKRGWGLTHFRYEPTDSSAHDKNQLSFEDPSPPQPVLVIGFPSSIGFELSEQKPLLRSGIVAMATGQEFLKVDGKWADERCSIVDTRVFRGNSGSPVMNQPRLGDSKAKLLGLMIATNERYDYGIMEPVSRVRETLDAAIDTKREGIWGAMIRKKTKPMK